MVFRNASRAARRIGMTFALRKFEATEPDRALAAYASVGRRIEDIGEQPRGIRGFWRELLGRSDLAGAVAMGFRLIWRPFAPGFR